MRPSLHALALAVALAGCAGAQPRAEHAAVSPPSAVAPGDELERELLRRLPELPPEQPVSIQDATVLAGAPYFAASGRTCRALTIQGTAQSPAQGTAQSPAQGTTQSPAQHADRSSGAEPRPRLACREDGDWFFVPQVFRPGQADPSHAP
jgi:hypothetical protein